MRFFFPVILFTLWLMQLCPLPAAAKETATTDLEAATLEDYAAEIDAMPPKDQEIPRMALGMMRENKLPVLYPGTPGMWMPGPGRYFTPLELSEWNALSQPADQDANGLRKLSGYRILAFFTPESWRGKWEARCMNADFRHRRGVSDKVGEASWESKKLLHARVIVFGPGIFPKDLIWEDPYTLKSTTSGASLRITPQYGSLKAPQPCFNLVFAETGIVPEFNWKAFYERL